LLPTRKDAWVSNPPEPDGQLTSQNTGYLPISRLYQSGLSDYGKASELFSEEQLNVSFAAAVRQMWTQYSVELSKSIAEVQQKGLAEILRFVFSGGATVSPAGGSQGTRRRRSTL
jgi:hypothetical protein